jgi:hypothetical protein
MPKLGNPLEQLAVLPARLQVFFKGLPDWLSERWRQRSVTHVVQVVNWAGIAVGTVWFIALLLVHMKIITQPGPQEFNEPAIWQTTWLLDHGRNPYTLQELPGAAYCFGPLYNYVVLAFKPLLGIDYPAHRMVVLIFLLGSLGVLLRAMQKAGAGLGIALLSVVFYYWMSLGNIEITARPDTLGLFFFLLGLFVPWDRGYTLGSTMLGLACAVVAFNFKSYFAVAGCATLLTHFLVRDKQEACWLGVGFFALLGLTFGISCYLYPYYYIETVIVQRGGAIVNDRDDISIMHTIMLFERGWPYFLLMLSGLTAWVWRRAQTRRREGRKGWIGRIGWPTTLAERRFLALGTVMIIFLMIVYFYMGRNAGAYFTYHLHLLFPLMFVLAAYAVGQRWLRVVAGLGLLGFFLAWVNLPDVPDSVAPYHRLERLIFDTHSEVLGIAAVTDIFERDGRHVLHNGNTMFMGFAFANDRALHDKKVGALAEKFDQAEAEVRAKVEARAYGLVLSEFDDPYFCSAEILKKNYDKVEQVDYYTYFGHSPVRVWRPKPRVAAPVAP